MTLAGSDKAKGTTKCKRAKGSLVQKASLWADGGLVVAQRDGSVISFSRLDLLTSPTWAQITFCGIESLTANCLFFYFWLLATPCGMRDLGSSTKDRNHTSLKWKHQVLKLVDHFHLEVSKLHVKSLYTWGWFMLMYDGNHQNIVITL